MFLSKENSQEERRRRGRRTNKERGRSGVGLGNEAIETTLRIGQTVPRKDGVLLGRWSLVILWLGMPVEMKARQLHI